MTDDAALRAEWIRLIDERIAEQQLDREFDAEGVHPGPLERRFELAGEGESAFQNNCLSCHDADRALSRQKSYNQWVATVRRMAGKEDANIPNHVVEPIAAYLASLAGGSAALETESGTNGPMESVEVFGTLSPLWRGSSGEHALENPGFFVDAWVGASWQPNHALSAKVTACTSCHSDENVNNGGSGGFTLEVVEASVNLDLNRLCNADETCDPILESSIQAGRMIVPFGAFSRLSHPGRSRTVSNPLMFNMGRRVGPVRPLQPVLPMPYADEGINLHANVDLTACWSATVDIYAVNGLQAQNPGLVFNSSRRYVDNNREPAIGGRVTVGTKTLRFGGSVMSGDLADDGLNSVLYKLGGVDVTWRHEDWLRFYFEYAIREDTLFLANADENYVYGIVTELEANLTPTIALLARYDTLEHRHAALGDSTTERFTYGLNFALPAGSWLMINHEHWMFADTDDDVVGVRWTATF